MRKDICWTEQTIRRTNVVRTDNICAVFGTRTGDSEARCFFLRHPSRVAKKVTGSG